MTQVRAAASADSRGPSAGGKGFSALTRAPQTLGLNLNALEDPPLRTPAPPPRAAPAPLMPPIDDLTPMLARLHLAPPPLQMPSETEDIAASLAAARRRADAAEASLKAAKSTAASMVAEASNRYRFSALAGVGR